MHRIKSCKCSVTGSKAILERAFKFGAALSEEGAPEARQAGRNILKRCAELAVGHKGLIKSLVVDIAGDSSQ